MKITLHLFTAWLVAFLAPPDSRARQLFNDQQHSVPAGTARPAVHDPQAVPEGLAKSDWSGIRAAYEAGRHAFQPIEGGWKARNPGQQWTTKFDGRGFLTEPRDGSWTWGLELKSYGFGENQRIIAGTPTVKADGQRLSYQWDAAVEEWFVNDPRGLEHGFTLKKRPDAPRNAPHSTLNFLLSSRGALRPCVSADAQGVLFQDASGATVINYTGLKVWDADGKMLASHFAPSEGGVRLLVDESGARYPLTIDPIAQQAYLKPAAVGTTQLEDDFGRSVAISGDTIIVGAPREDSGTTGVNSTADESATDSGAAYVFVRSGGGWTQQAYLKPTLVGISQARDRFGRSVAISGNTVVIGALDEDSSSTGVNSTPNDSGSSAGGAFSANCGAAYVFVRTAGVWTQQAYLKPAAVGTTLAGDAFGFSVAISGDTIVVGSVKEDSDTLGVNGTPEDSQGVSFDAGAAYVFVRSAGAWTQQAFLKPESVGFSQKQNYFGWAVAVSGDTVAVGVPFEDGGTTGVNSTPDYWGMYFDSGAVYVFARNAGAWTQQAYLKPGAVGSTQENDSFGLSVALAGDTLVVGAPDEDSNTTGVNSVPNDTGPVNSLGFYSFDSGAAYIFARNAGTWTQQAYLKPDAVGTTQEDDKFGASVAISGDTVVVGAVAEDGGALGVNGAPDEAALNAGAAYVFTRSVGTWTQQAYLKPAAVGSTQARDAFGTAVAISGETAIVGARSEDSGTTGVNSTPGDDFSDPGFNSGAAYIFTRAGSGVPDADGDGLLDAWELTFWLTRNDHSPLDDSDGDGYVELLELALGLNPTLPNPGGLPAAINEGGYLTMTITKQPGVFYEIQSAGTLLPALPDSFSAASTTVLINDATTLKVRDNFLIGTPPNRFMRVKVTAAP